jgi:hypothetical protein
LFHTGLKALVVVVDRDGEDFLRVRLPYYVLIQNVPDFVRNGKLAPRAVAGLLLYLFADDVVAELNAFVANENRRPCDELANFVLALAAEGAVKKAVSIGALGILAIAHLRVLDYGAPDGLLPALRNPDLPLI